jgi:transketolase N-terminal domain/subunit
MALTFQENLDSRYEPLSEVFDYWEKIKDLIDNTIDVILNYRQSGHPGGSRSKVYPMVALLLSGTMRWDIRRPDKKFSDRFILCGTLVNARLALQQVS